jgi:hypothetical protein
MAQIINVSPQPGHRWMLFNQFLMVYCFNCFKFLALKGEITFLQRFASISFLVFQTIFQSGANIFKLFQFVTV